MILALTTNRAFVSLTEMWGHDISVFEVMKGVVAHRA
jgi:hypothetical protein